MKPASPVQLPQKPAIRTSCNCGICHISQEHFRRCASKGCAAVPLPVCTRGLCSTAQHSVVAACNTPPPVTPGGLLLSKAAAHHPRSPECKTLHPTPGTFHLPHPLQRPRLGAGFQLHLAWLTKAATQSAQLNRETPSLPLYKAALQGLAAA